MTLEGKITLTLEPPGYRQSLQSWDEHPDLQVISELLGNNIDNERENEQISVENIDMEFYENFSRNQGRNVTRKSRWRSFV